MPRNSFIVGVAMPRNTPSSVMASGPDAATASVTGIAIRMQAAVIHHTSRTGQFRLSDFPANFMTLLRDKSWFYPLESCWRRRRTPPVEAPALNAGCTALEAEAQSELKLPPCQRGRKTQGLARGRGGGAAYIERR